MEPRCCAVDVGAGKNDAGKRCACGIGRCLAQPRSRASPAEMMRVFSQSTNTMSRPEDEREEANTSVGGQREQSDSISGEVGQRLGVDSCRYGMGQSDSEQNMS